jgi:tRNA pseudouridine55 synthase
MDQLTPEDYQAGKVFLFDKEKDWTSFDLVNKLRLSLRNELGIKKIKPLVVVK